MDVRLSDAVFSAPAAPTLGGPGPPAPVPAEPKRRTARVRVTSEAVGVRGALGGYYRSLPPWIDDLTREYGPDTYERMQLDDQVSSSLRALCHGVLSDDLVLRPAVDDDGDPDFAAAKDALSFCERATWGQAGGLDQWLFTMVKGAVGGGNRVSETVYRPEESGKDAGKWVPDRLKVKPRRSVAFAVDGCNNLTGILGLPPGGASWGGLAWGTTFDPAHPPPNFLPREKFCVLTWDPHDEDPRGSAILRCVYEPWWAKLQAAREWLAYLAQFGSPGLVGTTASGADSSAPTDADGNPVDGPVLTPEQDMLNKILEHRNGGVHVLPNGATLDVLQTSNAGDAFLKKVDSCDRAIAQGINLAMRAVMQSRFGSRADAEQGQDVAGLQTRFMKRWLARMVTEDLLRPLVRINYGPDAARRLCPYASLSPVEHQDLGPSLVAVSGAWKNGLIKNSQLPWVYEQFGMPPATEEELAAPPPPQPPAAPGGSPGAPPAPGSPPAPPQAPFSADGPDLSGLGDLLNLSRQEVLDALFDAALDSFDLALPDASFGGPADFVLETRPEGSASFGGPDQPRVPAGQAGGGEWTSGGGGAGGKPKRVRLRDLPGVTPLHLADHVADLADSHFRNMRAIMKGLLDGNYTPKDAAAEVDRYRDGANRANHARHAKFEARLGNKLEETYGAAAMDSPQWDAVLAAVESSEAEAGTHVEDMADAVRNLAAYYLAHPGEPVHIRKGTDDANRVGEIHDDMVTAAHAEFHKIFDAVDAFKVAHRPLAGFAAFALPDAPFYSPDQPRVPAGQPGGGEFGPGGGGAGAGDDRVARRAAGDARRARAAARQEAAEARYREKAAEIRAKVDPAHVAVVLDAVTQLLPKYFRRGRFGGADSDSVPEGALLGELDRRGLLDARRVYPAKVHQLLARMVFLGDLVRVEEGTGDVLSGRKRISYRLPRKADVPFYSPDQPRDELGRWTQGYGTADRPGFTPAQHRERRQAAADAVRAFARGQGPPTAAEAEAVAGHLARLTVAQIHALKAEHGLKGSAPNKAAMVAKLAERFRAHRGGQAVTKVQEPGGRGTTPAGFLGRAREVLGEEEVRRLVHLPLAETHREYGRKHQAFRNEEARAVADIIAARTVPGFNYGSVPRPQAVEPGEVKRVEAGPFNFVLYRDAHGKHEVLVSSGGRFMDPKDARDRGLLDEAKAALGLPQGWIQGDPVPATPAAPPPPAPPAPDLALAQSAVSRGTLATPAEAAAFAGALRDAVVSVAKKGSVASWCDDVALAVKHMFPSAENWQGEYVGPKGPEPHTVAKVGPYWIDVTADQFGGKDVQALTALDPAVYRGFARAPWPGSGKLDPAEDPRAVRLVARLERNFPESVSTDVDKGVGARDNTPVGQATPTGERPMQTRELTAKAAAPEFYEGMHKYSGVRAAMAKRFRESGREARGEPSVTKLSARYSGPPEPGTVLWRADGPHLVVSSEVRDLPGGPTQRFVTVPVVPTDADHGIEAEYLRHAVSARVAGPVDDRARPAFEAETARMLARLRQLEGGV